MSTELKSYNTWADLKEFVNNLNNEELIQPLRYWAVDGGGRFTVFQLEEEYVYDGEGMSPVSPFQEDDLAECRADNAVTMAKGTPLVGIGVYVEPYEKSK